jgi:hypothetical protein
VSLNEDVLTPSGMASLPVLFEASAAEQVCCCRDFARGPRGCDPSVRGVKVIS